MEKEIEEVLVARGKSKMMARMLLDFAKEFYLKPENKARYEKWKAEREKERGRR